MRRRPADFLPETLGILILAALGLAGCASIATYNQAAYEHATDAKVEALALFDEASDDYGAHAQKIAAVTLQLRKAYEYDRGRSLNSDSTQLWELILVEKPEDPESGIYSRFISLWKSQGRISAAAIPGKKARLAQAFDKIIALENGKIR